MLMVHAWLRQLGSISVEQLLGSSLPSPAVHEQSSQCRTSAIVVLPASIARGSHPVHRIDTQKVSHLDPLVYSTRSRPLRLAVKVQELLAIPRKIITRMHTIEPYSAEQHRRGLEDVQVILML